jgi:exopolysaccharide biosynthesis polyprenyl glycosylphosphotransferase
MLAPWTPLLSLAVSACLTSFAIGLYRPETFLRLRRLLFKTALAALLSFPAIWVIGRLVGLDFGLLLGHAPLSAHLPEALLPRALLPLRILTGWISLVVIIRLAFSYLLRMNLFSRRVVIIGTDDSALRTADAIDRLCRGLFEVAGTLRDFDRSGDPADAAEVMRQLRQRRIWGVVIAESGPQAQAMEQALRRQSAGVEVWGDSSFWEGQLRRVDIDQLGENETEFHAVSARRGGAALRRASDIVLSLILLGFTLPLMLLTALVIRIDSPGGVFYRQERVGLDGRPFVLCKFRSMRSDAEALGPVWAAKRDARVTRVGAFIRRTRIDELPQLMNVLRGEMSFIGPRPERPHFVEQLSGLVPFYRERTRVKPGLTGWAQVNYPYGASVEDARMKLSFDLYYVKHHSLFLDVLILFSTVRVILFQEGAR